MVFVRVHPMVRAGGWRVFPVRRPELNPLTVSYLLHKHQALFREGDVKQEIYGRKTYYAFDVPYLGTVFAEHVWLRRSKRGLDWPVLLRWFTSDGPVVATTTLGVSTLAQHCAQYRFFPRSIHTKLTQPPDNIPANNNILIFAPVLFDTAALRAYEANMRAHADFLKEIISRDHLVLDSLQETPLPWATQPADMFAVPLTSFKRDMDQMVGGEHFPSIMASFIDYAVSDLAVSYTLTDDRRTKRRTAFFAQTIYPDIDTRPGEFVDDLRHLTEALVDAVYMRCGYEATTVSIIKTRCDEVRVVLTGDREPVPYVIYCDLVTLAAASFAVTPGDLAGPA